MKKKTVAEWYQVSKKAAGIEGGWNNSDLELNAEIFRAFGFTSLL